MLTADDLLSTGHPLDVRDGDVQVDAIDGIVPRLVIEPHTAEGVAATLAWAAGRRLGVLIQGGGTKRAWGRRPDRLDAILGMRKLNRVIAHRHGDLTVTVEAGLTLQALNQMLGARGQQLPLDAPFADRATVGGILATNDSGPLRHRFGTPRDLVIGIHLATPDGILAKAGGQVVKNVAGYDLSRLVAGSFGTLAAIISATFKLAPVAASSKTLVLPVTTPERLTGIVQAISASQLEPQAFDIHVHRGPGVARATSCLMRFASVAAAVDAQVDEAIRLVAPFGVEVGVLSGADEERVWQGQSLHILAGQDAVVRLSWLPARLDRVLSVLDEVATAIDVEAHGRAGVGAGWVRLAGPVNAQAAAVERLRQSDDVGNVVLMHATPELKELVDVWGPRRNVGLLDAVRRAVDPYSTLGAGRV